MSQPRMHDDEVDGEALLDLWARVVRAPDYDGPPVWFHGDLSYLNLLARDGALSAVIDWGTCGVGGIPYYRDTNPVLAADKIRAINAVLADSA